MPPRASIPPTGSRTTGPNLSRTRPSAPLATAPPRTRIPPAAISGVSCFKCHANGPSHQPGWGPAACGRLGAPGAHQLAGFAYCAKCHGSTYDNPVGITPSCRAATPRRRIRTGLGWHHRGAAQPCVHEHRECSRVPSATRMERIPPQAHHPRARWNGAGLLQQHHVPRHEHPEFPRKRGRSFPERRRPS